MVELLKGKPVEEKITKESLEIIGILEKKNIVPTMSIIRIGDNPDDISYERSIIRYSDKLGVRVNLLNLDADISQEELLKEIDILNNNEDIGGVLMLRPFPKHIDDDMVRNFLSLDKDIDCMNTLSLARLFEGDMTGFKPCTAKAVLETLLHNDIELEGKTVAIINRSTVVGKPLAMMLMDRNATVTICHSKTKNLSQITRNVDIVISALGRAKFLTEEYFNGNSIAIDVGMSLDHDGKLSGDIDYDNVVENVKMITPVPGGVGRITTSILINQLLRAYV